MKKVKSAKLSRGKPQGKRAILLGPVQGSVSYQKDLFSSLEIKSTDLLIGVDGGLRVWKSWGVIPHLAVGDWDSLQNKRLLKGLIQLSLPQNKERSDLFYAALAAIEAGATEILCLGVTAGRADHHLATLMDLSHFSTGAYGNLQSVEAWGADAKYFFLSSKIPSWKGAFPYGSVVSVFAMKDGAQGVTMKGFEYGLKNAVLLPSSHGLSNRVCKTSCEVQLGNGQLVVVIPHE